MVLRVIAHDEFYQMRYNFQRSNIIFKGIEGSEGTGKLHFYWFCLMVYYLCNSRMASSNPPKVREYIRPSIICCNRLIEK